MRKTHLVDWLIVLVAAACCTTAFFYIPEESGRNVWLLGFGAVAVFFAALALRNRRDGPGNLSQGLGKRGRITELVLLSEEDTELTCWELYGKASMVIGRDVGENHVDVNLNQAAYASMIDLEHAVMNYSGGNWYIEDIGSKNGLSIQKVQDGRKYRLSADQPCLLDRGDIVFVGLTRLLVR